jgi:ABC-type dipeptide/oligopeptide/nickel transport system ATPase subunit
LLHVESGAEVFGYRLAISRDAHGTTPCPLQVFPGAITYLKAPSGTGKTTLVKLIMGLVQAARLNFTLDGTMITERTRRRYWQKHMWGKEMTMVFQHADEAINSRATVRQTFQGLPSRKPITTEAIRKTLRELFDMEIDDAFLHKRVVKLSGGQKQRLNLLRCLFLDTRVLILDEPLNGLDFESITRVLAMLKAKQRDGKGILLISHNEEIFDAMIPGECVYYLHSQRVVA